MDNKNQVQAISWLNVTAGIWLILSPFILGSMNEISRTNDIWLGGAIGIIALIRAMAPLQVVWLSWVNIILGLWLIIAPFVFGYTSLGARWNDIVLGIIVALLAIWNSGATSMRTTNRPPVRIS